MSDEQRFFLSVFRQPPARLTVEQVGWVLNCASHNIRILVRAGLLKPLGDPPENGEKVFHTDDRQGQHQRAERLADAMRNYFGVMDRHKDRSD